MLLQHRVLRLQCNSASSLCTLIAKALPPSCPGILLPATLPALMQPPPHLLAQLVLVAGRTQGRCCWRWTCGGCAARCMWRLPRVSWPPSSSTTWSSGGCRWWRTCSRPRPSWKPTSLTWRRCLGVGGGGGVVWGVAQRRVQWVEVGECLVWLDAACWKLHVVVR